MAAEFEKEAPVIVPAVSMWQPQQPADDPLTTGGQWDWRDAGPAAVSVGVLMTDR
ncbi:MAG TPA: hypothetical protein PL117_16370 [Accumulibacter sp.]|uniref:hypothetical protein n=1 Tax=Accumulibacter sp. TaxID=2053492 RepID=UPI002BB9A3A5|nr:hypothetical protein [Accumulibacter sp.]HRF74341.1 hypothetical protein [Accumulibacter sp.]